MGCNPIKRVIAYRIFHVPRDLFEKAAILVDIPSGQGSLQLFRTFEGQKNPINERLQGLKLIALARRTWFCWVA